MQFQATAMHLYGLRRSSIYYYIAMVIQVTAFIMTLQRKNIITHIGASIFYATLLAIGLGLGAAELVRAGWKTLFIVECIANLAALLRMRPKLRSPSNDILRSKYAVWTTVYLWSVVVRRTYATTTENDIPHQRYLVFMTIATKVGLMLLGRKLIKSFYNNKNSK